MEKEARTSRRRYFVFVECCQTSLLMPFLGREAYIFHLSYSPSIQSILRTLGSSRDAIAVQDHVTHLRGQGSILVLCIPYTQLCELFSSSWLTRRRMDRKQASCNRPNICFALLWWYWQYVHVRSCCDKCFRRRYRQNLFRNRIGTHGFCNVFQNSSDDPERR